MRVLVLAGGESGEREVSLTSGAAIWSALERLGHTVSGLDPATGRHLRGGESRLETVENAGATAGQPSPSGLQTALELIAGNTDVVFIGLHGGRGENGSIQNMLDLTGVVYTGSGMTASAVCMNKALTKRLMRSVDIATPDWELHRLGGGDAADELAEDIARRYPLPLIIKPNDGGSTVGLTKVDTVEAIAPAINAAARETGSVLIEEYLAGRELTVSVLDGRAYPVVEIKPKNGLYDYEAKYTKGSSEYVAPAEINTAVAEQAQAAAIRLYQATECEGLARVDFILNTAGRLYCLEINTLPGMTELSLAPMALGCEGIGFDQLVQMIIDSALRK